MHPPGEKNVTTKKEAGGSSTNLTTAIAEAQNILAAAEKRARELLAEAQGVFDAAEEKGYQNGLALGRRDAVEEAVRLIENSPALSARLSEEAARLAIAISANIVGQHIAVSPDAALQIASNAMQEAITGDSVTLTVHPDDVEVLTRSLEDLRKIAGGASVAIEADKKISRGGCLVRTEFGEVDATIEALLASVAERLGLTR
jgi:type III secretion system HrpE/YscL family protein